MNKSLVSVCVLFSRAATLIVEMKIIATIFVEPRHPEKKFCEHWGGAPGASSQGKTQDRVFSSAPSVSRCTSLRGCPTAS